MLSERTIINALLLVTGVILGPYLIILTLELNQVALLAFAGLVFFFCVFFFLRERVSAFPLIGAYFKGALNFLPFGFTLVEVFSLMSICYYLINYVALKRRPIDGGPRSILFPMLVIAAIVLYHDHNLGLHALGSSEQGSRPGVLILVAITAYICGINMPTPSALFLNRIPWLCLGMTCVSSVPYILTTFIPSLAPYVYYVSGNVNVIAYLEASGSVDAESVGRDSSLVGISGVLQGILVAYYPLSTLWRPGRWIVALLGLFCLYGVVLSGYRNAFMSFALVVLISTICYSRWRTLILLPIIALAPIALLFVQDNHPNGITLPATVQRSLSFLPANWDRDVIYSADSSNDFRAEIKRIYVKEYLYKSPWFGNGFSFDPGESEGLHQMAQTPGVSDPGYYETKAFLVSKNFHVGWISLYDAVGIIGGIATILLNFALIGLAGTYIFRKGADMSSPLFPVWVWLFTSLTSGLISYFTTFGSFNQALIGCCSVGVILVHLQRAERQQTVQVVTPTSAPFKNPNRSIPASPVNISS